MSIAAGPSIVTTGLLLELDAANQRSYPNDIEVLVVAGGGGGGTYAAGAGGGGGGVVYYASYPLPTSASVTVGNGGTGGDWGGVGTATAGQNSAFGSITAIGGGQGGIGWSTTVGGNGGSGGGGAGYDGTGGTSTVAGGTGTAGQGFSGGVGRGISGNRGAGGGGGGAGGVGGDSTTTSGGNGGPGIACSITGSVTYYGGGGGGGDYGSSNGGIGGSGGGGNVSGGNSSGIPGYAGTANTGGGGGGSRSATADSWKGGNGGSGVVIIRYRGPQQATGGTITSFNGYTIHTFTSSSSFLANRWTDISGNGTIGTLTNGPTYNSSNTGSVVFDGVDDYAISGASASYDLSIPNFTIEVWFYGNVAMDTSTIYHNVMSFTNSAFDLGIWRSGLYPGCLFNTFGGSTMFGTDGSGGSYAGANYKTTGKWNCITFTRVSTTMYFYINGAFWASKATPAISSTSNAVVLGSNTAFNSLLIGNIPSFKFYNVALTADQVLQNFNALRGRYGI